MGPWIPSIAPVRHRSRRAASALLAGAEQGTTPSASTPLVCLLSSPHSNSRCPLFDGRGRRAPRNDGDRRRAGDDLFYDARMFRLRGGPQGAGARSSRSTSISSWRAVEPPSCSVLRARASRRCCACAWASSRPTRARSPSTAAPLDRAARRRIGYVIQEGGLFPHLTAAAERRRCRRAGQPRAARRRAPRQPRRAGAAAAAAARALSARAVGRAAATGEPDARAHARSRGAAARRAVRRARSDHPRRAADGSAAHRRASSARPIVLVTHDLGDAAALADEVILLRAGRVVQRGPLGELVRRRPIRSSPSSSRRSARRCGRLDA